MALKKKTESQLTKFENDYEAARQESLSANEFLEETSESLAKGRKELKNNEKDIKNRFVIKGNLIYFQTMISMKVILHLVSKFSSSPLIFP